MTRSASTALGRRVREAGRGASGKPVGSAASKEGAFFLELAVRYLARSDKPSSDIARYLTRRGASPAATEATLRQLTRLGYLDEADQARRFVERRLTRRPVGRARLTEELLQRGFSEAVVEETIRTMFASIDEAELASRALARRADGETVAQRGQFLQNRGFSTATISQVLHIDIEE